MSETQRQVIERQADRRCEYCRAPQRVRGYRFHIEHITPRTLGGSDDASNLALVCASCNLAKGPRTQETDPVSEEVVDVIHPRLQVWVEHFAWDADGFTLVGLTPCGRATVVALDMNAPIRLESRSLWHALWLLP